jgi:hypothetical protein
MLWDKLPEELRALPEAQYLYSFGCVTTMDIVQLIYRPQQMQGQTKDYEFSRRTMQERWEQGQADALATLRASPWLEPMPYDRGARTFDVLGPHLDGGQGFGATGVEASKTAEAPAVDRKTPKSRLGRPVAAAD